MAPGEGGGVERGGNPRDGQRWCGHEFLVCSWYETFMVMVELKMLEFSKLGDVGQASTVPGMDSR